MTTIGKVVSSAGVTYVSVTQKKKVPLYFSVKNEEITQINETDWKKILKRKKVKLTDLKENQQENILGLANLFQKKKITAKVIKITKKYTGQTKPGQSNKIVNF